ncbi:hypothetical protein BV898_16299 [Hypsibius exemplaris]|uniref:GTP cyclohydrolase 1 feedback regulatory protein n=1 Tax=Hypsibius exemplaris TaxID=2072580 RepID=A0A9X6NK02_HYPEX|nr:hypothetical protein BV898_16299 [Hypsibius exemplaris]
MPYVLVTTTKGTKGPCTVETTCSDASVLDSLRDRVYDEGQANKLIGAVKWSATKYVTPANIPMVLAVLEQQGFNVVASHDFGLDSGGVWTLHRPDGKGNPK